MSTTTAPAVVAAPALTTEQQGRVVSAAAEFVAATIQRRPARLGDSTLAGAAEVAVAGAYVTLKRRGHLRACCGLLGEPRRLVDALRHAAFRTATEDHRLPPIAPGELRYLDLEVSLLHTLEPLRARGAERVEAVVVGRHGLRVQRGEAGGLLLPSVPVEHGWDAEAFLRHACRKAGLPTTAWQDDDTRLFTFEALRAGGPFDPDIAGPVDEVAPPLAPDELERLAEHARRNILALARGLTPDYYLAGMPDGTVAGVALSLSLPGRDGPSHVSQVSLRPGLPLQATVFRLCELAAQALRGAAGDADALRVGVTILHDPALHGNVGDPDLRGLDPRRRGVLVLEQDRSACVVAPSRPLAEVLETARDEAQVRNATAAAVVGVAAQSTEPEVIFGTVPRPVPAGGVRPPAVAGRFYPADPAELARLVDDLMGGVAPGDEPWPAVMVPHAGLVYSGRLAAAVFARVSIPDLVIVLGPKHTRHGVPWAVAPHASWSIPGATVAADPDLARALAEAIPGLHLDAAAHRQEHAIEVELPFLARRAPRSRVVGLAIGGGDWENCSRFAAGLADVIGRLDRRPLLVISSDMNHFATDRETRLLDEVALGAMERLDPAHVLETVTGHDISMCGVLPAVIVMEALRRLGGLRECRRVGYATSADVTGDTSRVVGYAGMLLA